MKNRGARIVLSAVTSALVMLGIAACSSAEDDSPQDFCAMAEAQATEMSSSDPVADPAAYQAMIAKYYRQIQEITPPAEIADEFAVYVEAYGELATEIAALDPADEATFLQNIMSAATAMGGDDFNDINNVISTYTMENCNIPGLSE